MSYFLENASILLDHGFVEGQGIWIENKKIKAICPKQSAPKSLTKFDLKGQFLAPALIDLQVNGFGGISLNPMMTVEALKQVHHHLMHYGCCSYLPTLISAPFSVMQKNLSVIRTIQKELQTAILGIHFEGPYLNPEKKGIHNERYIRAPSEEEISSWTSDPQGIALMTIAPEQFSERALQQLKAAHIPLSVGHSQATYVDAQNSFNHGICAATHLFNAMPALKSREPGLIGAILNSKEIFTCLIPDGHHVAWPCLKIALNSIPADRLCLVTDALPAAGSRLTHFNFADKAIFVKDHCCCDAQGKLAGSQLTPLQALQNAVWHLDLPLDRALYAFSRNPAQLLNRSEELGMIRVGAFANLIVLNHQLQLNSVIFEGTWTIKGI